MEIARIARVLLTALAVLTTGVAEAQQGKFRVSAYLCWAVRHQPSMHFVEDLANSVMSRAEIS